MTRAAVKPTYRKYETKAPASSGEKKYFSLWLLPLLTVMAIGTIWLRLYIIRTTYSIDQADQAIRNLQQEKEQLQLKVTARRSPRKLEVLARAKFGLSQPRSEQVIHMRSAAPERSAK